MHAIVDSCIDMSYSEYDLCGICTVDYYTLHSNIQGDYF
jgi:hypothetical protein